MIPRVTCDCNGSIVEYSVENRFVGTGVLLFCFLGYLQMVPVNGDFCFESGAKVSKNVVEYQKVNYANKKESCHPWEKNSHGSAAFLFEAVIPSLWSEPHY